MKDFAWKLAGRITMGLNFVCFWGPTWDPIGHFGAPMPEGLLERRPLTEAPKKSTQVSSKGVQKGQPKKLDAHGGPWSEALILVAGSSKGGP